jgi:hypothetical protein
MAYPLDTSAQNAGLQAWFGDGRAASVPSSWEVALFTDHPLTGGVELDAVGGYVPLVVANSSANFPDPVDGVVTSVNLTWPDPTDAYSDVATTYVLRNAADSTAWYVGVLGAAIDVTEAGPGFSTQLAIRWNTEGA